MNSQAQNAGQLRVTVTRGCHRVESSSSRFWALWKTFAA